MDEALAGRSDTLLDSLRNHQTLVDPNLDGLVGRLVQRLRGAATSESPDSGTIAAAMPEAVERKPLPERLEYSRIQKALGEGGMGTVYLADDMHAGTSAAGSFANLDFLADPAAILMNLEPNADGVLRIDPRRRTPSTRPCRAARSRRPCS